MIFINSKKIESIRYFSSLVFLLIFWQMNFSYNFRWFSPANRSISTICRNCKTWIKTLLCHCWNQKVAIFVPAPLIHIAFTMINIYFAKIEYIILCLNYYTTLYILCSLLIEIEIEIELILKRIMPWNFTMQKFDRQRLTRKYQNTNWIMSIHLISKNCFVCSIHFKIC